MGLFLTVDVYAFFLKMELCSSFCLFTVQLSGVCAGAAACGGESGLDQQNSSTWKHMERMRDPKKHNEICFNICTFISHFHLLFFQIIAEPRNLVAIYISPGMMR